MDLRMLFYGNIFCASDSTRVLRAFAQPCDREMSALIGTKLAQFKLFLVGNFQRKFLSESFPA